MNQRPLEAAVVALSILALIVGAVLIYRTSPPPSAPLATSTPTVVPTATIQTSGCHYRTAANGQPLPDPSCTPGAVDPRVSQANIQQTICRSGYTATVRPPVSFTEPLKRRQLAAYGQDVSQIASYEEDHRVPVEVGGAPMDEHNLWPELLSFARRKDQLENYLRRQVCNGAMTLQEGQEVFLGDFATWQQTHSASQ